MEKEEEEKLLKSRRWQFAPPLPLACERVRERAIDGGCHYYQHPRISSVRRVRARARQPATSGRIHSGETSYMHCEYSISPFLVKAPPFHGDEMVSEKMGESKWLSEI